MANILKVRLLKNLSDLQKLSPQERVAIGIKKYNEKSEKIYNN